MPLTIPEHTHEIQYHRQLSSGAREHAHTEVVDDQGFVLVHDPNKRERWLAEYTRTCADEYLGRVRARPGQWLVHVYRLLAGERHHVVSIRMQWCGYGEASTQVTRSD